MSGFLPSTFSAICIKYSWEWRLFQKKWHRICNKIPFVSSHYVTCGLWLNDETWLVLSLNDSIKYPFKRIGRIVVVVISHNTTANVSDSKNMELWAEFGCRFSFKPSQSLGVDIDTSQFLGRWYLRYLHISQRHESWLCFSSFMKSFVLTWYSISVIFLWWNDSLNGGS